MMGYVGIITILRLGLSHIAIDDGRILTMGHDGQGGCGKDTVQGLAAVHKHVASR